jgi:phage tail sheath protein FI
MTGYKHGTYGEFAESVGAVSTQSGTVAVYVGIAPVNLIRGYGDAVNTPVMLSDFESVKRYMGYSKNWAAFDLCEAFKVHFDNEAGNVGPIVAINVLDPAKHKKSAPTTKSLTFVNGRASFESDTIILDTLAVAESVEGVDFNLSYDFNKGQVIITAIGDALTGGVSVTYSEVDPSMVTAEDIIGGVTDGGEYTGLGCVALVYQQLGVIPNLIASPKWSEKPDVYKAMVAAATKINGHWDAFACVDIPILDGATKVDTRPLAKKWKADNGYTSEHSKVFWPESSDNAGNNYHTSVLAVWRTMMVDAKNNGIPMETPSNKPLPIAKQYFGEGSLNRGFDQQGGNDLNADGITTVIFWGGEWVLWGPHTAAYKHGAVEDNRVIFDNSIRMMMHVSNSFQHDHALTIDQPMTVAMADTIRNREQEKMDALAAVGAFIGTPVVEFRKSENSVGNLVEGNFVWGFKGTPTPPFKSGTLRVAYTTAGFDSYFGEV